MASKSDWLEAQRRLVPTFFRPAAERARVTSSDGRSAVKMTRETALVLRMIEDLPEPHAFVAQGYATGRFPKIETVHVPSTEVDEFISLGWQRAISA